MITHSQKSIDLLAEISKTVKTFHHHFHVLYDIANTFEGHVNYVEIGCYAGASACLMTQRPNTRVFSIDTGTPIAPGIATANVLRHNTLGNVFEYIQGSSHDVAVLNKLRTSLNGQIDILFIDGGHSYDDVLTDFDMYQGLVKPGGYIVFDDYLDKEFSPEVRPAVDKILTGIENRYEIIGSLKNEIGAPPAEVKESNCFIIRKKQVNHKIGIVISTYRRPDGKSPFYIKRALDSIWAQTHQDYQVYLMGDHYDNDAELQEIASFYPKVKCINLPVAVERSTYPANSMHLWCCGGNTAVLTGIAEAMKDGIEYVCHHDHDDFWERNHLELINNVIQEKNPFFVCTMSTYNGIHLPYFPQTGEVKEFYPVPGGMICSSSCIKYSDTKLRARDVFKFCGKPNPADADLWSRMSEEMQVTGKKGYLICTLTCHHDEEGYTMHGKSTPV